MAPRQGPPPERAGPAPGLLLLEGRGGGRGLGLGAALALAHAGAAVAVVARTADQVEEAADGIRALGRDALGIVADVTDAGAPETCAAQVVAHFGRLDILVYSAGVNLRRPADEFSRDDYAAIMRVNAESAYFFARAVRPTMQAQGRGRIVVIGT